MGFKRKLSFDDSPFCMPITAAISGPDAQSPTFCSKTQDGIILGLDANSRSNAWDFTNVSRVKSSDWGNRTRKRVRDNRPDEHAIHEHTLNKLFSAQRNCPQTPAAPSDAQPIHHSTMIASKPQKSTLHSFWKQLPAPPVQPIFSLPLQSGQTTSDGPRCEDCDAVLSSEYDSMDVDMDLDGAVEGTSFACNGCARNVCGACAVVASTRHCLQCATTARNSRRWW